MLKYYEKKGIGMLFALVFWIERRETGQESFEQESSERFPYETIE